MLCHRRNRIVDVFLIECRNCRGCIAEHGNKNGQMLERMNRPGRGPNCRADDCFEAQLDGRRRQRSKGVTQVIEARGNRRHEHRMPQAAGSCKGAMVVCPAPIDCSQLCLMPKARRDAEKACGNLGQLMQECQRVPIRHLDLMAVSRRACVRNEPFALMDWRRPVPGLDKGPPVLSADEGGGCLVLHMPDRPTQSHFVLLDAFRTATQRVVSADSTGGYTQPHFEIRD